MQMKWLLFLFIILSWDPAFGYDARHAERYYINDNSVLFYKIISWWYDCLPGDSEQVCGSRLKYQNIGNAKAEYNGAERILELRIQGGFTEQLIIFKHCTGCFGPSYLKCTGLNRKYFGNAVATNISSKFPTDSSLMIKNVNKKHARLIQGIGHDIIFELEGVIGGLLNGKIALHQAGTFLRNCPDRFGSGGENVPISFKIINSRTNEILAHYTAIWEH